MRTVPLKIKINFDRIWKNLTRTRDGFNKIVVKQFKGDIKDVISKGLSPVKGAGRFLDYSGSYKKQIDENDGVIKGTDGRYNTGKNKRPVNLSVSGTMMKTLSTREAGRKVRVKFGSKFARYHNQGNGVPRRPLLPSESGEEFSRVLTKKMIGYAKKSINKFLTD